MMSITESFEVLKASVVRNGPAILTAVGAAGVVSSAVLASRATVLAVRRYDELVKENPDAEFTPMEKVRILAPFYISTAAVVAVSCTAIVLANRIEHKRATSVAAALTISERAFTEYQNKVVEKIGVRKEEAVRDEVQQDRVSRKPSSDVVVLEGKQLCYDSYSGRYFESTMEEIKHAINRLNHQIVNQNYASLSDFYNYLGISPTNMSDDLGWNSDILLDVYFTTTLSPDGRPAIALDYRVAPKINYFRVH